MKKRSGNEGSVKGVIYLLIFVLMVFLAVKFATPFYHYYFFKMQAEGDLKIQSNQVKVVQAKVMETAQGFNVPVTEKDLIITVDGKHRTLKASWTEVVDIFGYYQKEFPFDLDIAVKTWD
jgi:hypothetical protein